MERFHGITGLFLAQPGDTALTVLYEVEEVIVKTRSPYQEIAVVKLKKFGKALVLDGLIQSTEADEYIYHEALVHPALTVHPEPKRVLILGGGEGATLREALKHSTVKEAVMVDIDPVVVEIARKHLIEWHRGAFDDPRARVVIMDGFKYVREAISRGEQFDVVIMDLTDPYGSEIAYTLYSRESFELLKKLVGSKGIVVTQAGNKFFFHKQYQAVLNNIRQVFSKVCEYGVWVPSFLYINNFIAASDTYDVCSIDAKTVDDRLRERKVETKMYSGRAHIGLVNAPNP